MSGEVSTACLKQTSLQTAIQLAGESHQVAVGCVVQHHACLDKHVTASALV